jgi:hypothetical protein
MGMLFEACRAKSTLSASEFAIDDWKDGKTYLRG